MNDESALARLLRSSRFEPIYANTEATMTAFGADAFAFHDASRQTFTDLAANSSFTKWGRPDRYLRVPVITINASTEDQSAILVGYPSIRRGHPERGIDIDFDWYRRDDPLVVTHHTGFTAEMRRQLSSTDPIRHISELNRLAAKGGLGGLDEHGRLRAHHSTGRTGDPLIDFWYELSFEQERRTRIVSPT